MSANKICETVSFSEIIQQALNEQERSQAWLARKCGITYAAMNRIVNGKTKPSISTVYSISKCINMPFADLAISLVGGDE